MTERLYPIPSTGQNKEFSSYDWRNLFSNFISDGVLTGLNVSYNFTDLKKIVVSEGSMIIEGVVYNSSSYTIELPSTTKVYMTYIGGVLNDDNKTINIQLTNNPDVRLGVVTINPIGVSDLTIDKEMSYFKEDKSQTIIDETFYIRDDITFYMWLSGEFDVERSIFLSGTYKIPAGFTNIKLDSISSGVIVGDGDVNIVNPYDIINKVVIRNGVEVRGVTFNNIKLSDVDNISDCSLVNCILDSCNDIYNCGVEVSSTNTVFNACTNMENLKVVNTAALNAALFYHCDRLRNIDILTNNKFAPMFNRCDYLDDVSVKVVDAENSVTPYVIMSAGYYLNNISGDILLQTCEEVGLSDVYGIDSCVNVFNSKSKITKDSRGLSYHTSFTPYENCRVINDSASTVLIGLEVINTSNASKGFNNIDASDAIVLETEEVGMFIISNKWSTPIKVLYQSNANTYVLTSLTSTDTLAITRTGLYPKNIYIFESSPGITFKTWYTQHAQPLVSGSNCKMTNINFENFLLNDGKTVPKYFFYAFNYQGALTSLPEGSFDTSNITTAGDSFFYAFNYQGALTSLPEGSFDTSNITTAGASFFYAFNSRGALTFLPEGSFDTSNITSAGASFFYDFNSSSGKLKSLPTSFALPESVANCPTDLTTGPSFIGILKGSHPITFPCTQTNAAFSSGEDYPVPTIPTAGDTAYVATNQEVGL